MNLNLSKPRVCFFAIFASLFGLAGLVPSSAQSTNAVNPRDFSAFQIINDRNIFDPNRRPRLDTPRRTPRAPQIVDSFSLVGTMSYSDTLIAFFEGTSADYRKSARPGEKIANYTISEIQHNLVRLTLDTNVIDLTVGMRMRRSQDGKWSAAEPTYDAPSSYVSENRIRGNDIRLGSSGEADASSDNEAALPDLRNLDPNDPVARMMLRRLQEQGVTLPQPAPPTVSENASNENGTNAQPAFEEPVPNENGSRNEPAPNEPSEPQENRN